MEEMCFQLLGVPGSCWTGGWVEAQQSDGNVRRSSGNELDLGSEGFERLPAAFNNLSLEKL